MNSDNQTQLTFLDTQLTTLNNNHSRRATNSNIKYLFDLPFDVRRDFCNLLDADKSWRELGGQFIGLNETDLELYSHAIMRNQSPTNTMLSKWEQSNITITHLYKCLAMMKHLRAMSILKPFVDSRLHYLCDFNELNTIITLTDAKDNQNANFISNPNYHNARQTTDNQNIANRRLPIINHLSNEQMKNLNLRREPVDTIAKNNNNNLNQVIDDHKLNPQYQTPSQFKNFSAVASTINAYDDNLPYEEILAATNNFHISNVIGSGGFGIVFKGLKSFPIN